MEKVEFAITTFDNPYDPFTEFDSWYRFDIDKNYNSCSLLARIAKTSDVLSEAENDLEIEKAIDEIIINDSLNIYKKVKRIVEVNDSPELNNEKE